MIAPVRLSFSYLPALANIELMNATTYTLEEAITVMRNLSKFQKTFSVKFRKLGGGDTIINRCSIRPMAATAKDKFGAYKLQLTNEDNGQPRSCYIPLIKEVNGIKVD